MGVWNKKIQGQWCKANLNRGFRRQPISWSLELRFRDTGRIDGLNDCRPSPIASADVRRPTLESQLSQSQLGPNVTAPRGIS